MSRAALLLASSLALACSAQNRMEPPNAAGASGSAGVGSGGDGAPAGVEMTSSGVCGFSQPVAHGAPGTDGMVDVPPDDPNIFYMGRIDCQGDGPAFAFPAASVRVRFEGNALDLRLRDSGTGTPQSTNYYDVSIDGAAPTRLEATPGDNVYALARDLGAGEHAAEIVKRVESNGNSGRGQVLGFRVREGARLLPTQARPLRLEFIGDSITCGYGDEVSTTTPDQFHYTTVNSNANLAYGAVVARQLDAEYVAVAISGRGVYRNYADGAGTTLPVAYDTTLPDDSSAPAWDFARYSPDVVVVNLGTNDFSPPGPDHDAFKAAYTAFLRKVRSNYPSALLLAVVGPMLNDGFPPGVMAWTTIQADVSGVVEALRAGGDDDVHYLALQPQSSPYGEDWHPTIATHQSMADAVAAEITRLRASE
jgi:lysophospholipase L1-like esterase